MNWITKKLQSLNKEQVRVLMLVHRNFVRSGAALTRKNKARFQIISKKLAEIGTKFSQNLLNDERDWVLKLESETLELLPSFLVQALKQAGKDRGIMRNFQGDICSIFVSLSMLRMFTFPHPWLVMNHIFVSSCFS